MFNVLIGQSYDTRISLIWKDNVETSSTVDELTLFYIFHNVIWVFITIDPLLSQYVTYQSGSKEVVIVEGINTIRPCTEMVDVHPHAAEGTARQFHTHQ